MTNNSSAKSQPGRRLALALAGISLLCMLGASGTRSRQPSPLAGIAPQRADYPHALVVKENFRFFAGGRALPFSGDVAVVTARLAAAETATRDLGVSLIPGLEVQAGTSARLFETAPTPREDATRLGAESMAEKVITRHPLAYRGVPLAPGSDILSIATATGQLLVVRERNLPRSVDGSEPTVDRAAAIRVAVEASRVPRFVV